jgi:6-pyruvoyltetrahydropterin/6-carboxytetrahydropterin synthase
MASSYTATLEYRFRVSHALETLFPVEHSHEWVFRLTLESDTLEDPGVIVDYFKLKALVKETLPPEGAHLNDWLISQGRQISPTAENLARFLYDRLKPSLPQLASVSVGEFPEFVCTYRPSP